MVGRKQRGRSRGRGYKGRDVDHGGRGGRGGQGRGRGLGSQDDAAIHERDAKFAFDSLSYRPGDRRNITRVNVGQVISNGDSGSNPRYQAPVQGSSSFRGSGSRYGRGRWGGRISPESSLQKDRAQIRHLESKLRHGTASLSQLLFEDRPLLKPISFVRSKYAPTLFLSEEEIFKSVAEEAGEQQASHVPTADRVFRIFHSDGVPKSSESPFGAEELLEIDFTDLGRVLNEVEALEAAAASKKITSTNVENVENQATVATVSERDTGVCIEIKPSPMRHTHLPTNSIPVDHSEACTLGADIDEDDEIIVYVAPHPRNGKLAPCAIQAATPLPPADSGPVTTNEETCRASRVATSPETPSLQSNPAPSSPIPPSPLKLGGPSSSFISGSTDPARGRRRTSRCATFGSFGAILAEAALREVDPGRDKQRRGDSDIDWGDSMSEESPDDEGMLVDQDIDTYAMEVFVKGMSTSRIAHVSADDLEDEAKIRAEDEREEKGDGESGAESGDSADDTGSELAGDVRDGLMSAGESELSFGDSLPEDGDEGTSDEEETPKRSFRARLERLRNRTKGRPIKDTLEEELDQGLEADEEGSIIAKIQDFLDDNDEILRAQDRKQRNRIFQAIQRGEFDIEIDFVNSTARGKKKKNIPEELHDQWERDRAKKAERKRLRELEQIAATVDPFTIRKGKGGKKACKAKLATTVARSMNLETIVGHMRRFIADIGGTRTLSFPPMNRKMRKSVHELAHTFKLESKSRGKGAERCTTLTKKTLSGVNVDEKKIARILGKSSSFPTYTTHERGGKGEGERKKRPRDGDVVGEAAPKLDGSNIGFRMLSAMGWEDGGRIGAVGGLEAPLVAVIKTTKLGLGASRG